MAGLVLLIGAQRWVTLAKPIDRDVMAYAVIGHELLAGRELYSDLWDHKPPAIYASFAVAELVAGYGPPQILLLSMVGGLACAWGAYFAGSALSQTMGLWAAGFSVALGGSLTLDAVAPNTELFINACVLWAFGLILRSEGARFAAKSRGLWAGAGAVFALASLYKPVVLAIAALLACAHVAMAPSGGEGRRFALRDVLTASAVGLTVWAGVFLYFAATGRLEAFYESVIGYNRYYSGDSLGNLVAPGHAQVQLIPRFLAPALAACLIGGMIAGAEHPRFWGLWVGLLLGTWIAIALPGRFWSHYYQLWFPPIALGAAAAITVTRRRIVPRWKAWLPAAAGAALFGSILAYQAAYLRGALRNGWEDPENGPWIDADRLAPRVDELLEPGETLFLYGDEPHLYFRTGRRPPVGVFQKGHFLRGPLADALSARAVSTLSRCPPELLIVETGYKKIDPWVTGRRHALVDWLRENYRPLRTAHAETDFQFFAWNGGRLAAMKRHEGERSSQP